MAITGVTDIDLRRLVNAQRTLGTLMLSYESVLA